MTFSHFQYHNFSSIKNQVGPSTMFPTPIVNNIDYDKVYEPAEDLFLLLDALEEESGFIHQNFTSIAPLVTEIGTGSGVVTTFIHQNILPDGIFISTDVNPHACQTALKVAQYNNDHADKKKPFAIDSCQMSLTTALNPRSVDILVFNPPYVPAFEVPDVPKTLDDNTWLDLALLGGEDGMVVTWELLNNLENVLSPRGVAYILFCARNHPETVAEAMRVKGWDVKTVISRKAGWEVLSVLKFLDFSKS